MNKAYQDSNTRHIQGAPAGYMVSKFLYILMHVSGYPSDTYVWFRGGMVNMNIIKVVECLICSFKGLLTIGCCSQLDVWGMTVNCCGYSIECVLLFITVCVCVG